MKGLGYLEISRDSGATYQEIFNNSRTVAHLAYRQPPCGTWEVDLDCDDCNCPILFAPKGLPLGFFDGAQANGFKVNAEPSNTAAPWYDATEPDSNNFLGFYVFGIDGWEAPIRRDVQERISGTGGGVAAPETVGTRPWKFKVVAFGRTEAGLRYGKKWLQWQLSALSSSCSTFDMLLRYSCPTGGVVGACDVNDFVCSIAAGDCPFETEGGVQYSKKAVLTNVTPADDLRLSDCETVQELDIEITALDGLLYGPDEVVTSVPTTHLFAYDWATLGKATIIGGSGFAGVIGDCQQITPSLVSEDRLKIVATNTGGGTVADVRFELAIWDGIIPCPITPLPAASKILGWLIFRSPTNSIITIDGEDWSVKITQGGVTTDATPQLDLSFNLVPPSPTAIIGRPVTISFRRMNDLAAPAGTRDGISVVVTKSSATKGA